MTLKNPHPSATDDIKFCPFIRFRVCLVLGCRHLKCFDSCCRPLGAKPDPSESKHEPSQGKLPPAGETLLTGWPNRVPGERGPLREGLENVKPKKVRVVNSAELAVKSAELALMAEFRGLGMGPLDSILPNEMVGFKILCPEA